MTPVVRIEVPRAVRTMDWRRERAEGVGEVMVM
jgi:hypothetical protein